MIRALVEQTFDSTKKYLVMFGLSTDTKPTAGLITGSEFHEVDTGVKYEFDEVGAVWHDVGITEDEIKAEIDAWLDDHPEATTTVEDGAISYAKLDATLKEAVDDVGTLNTEIQNKANVDGSYSTLTAGNAEQLVSTVGVNDKTPYLFRTTGGSADVGDRVKLSEITGGTVAWNQLISALRSSGTVYDLTVTNDNNKSLTISGTANSSGNVTVANAVSCVANHKYLVSCGADGITGARVNFIDLCPIGKSAYIVNATASSNVSPSLNVASGTVINMELVLCIFDLTAMFGSAIADYLCALESGTAGAGVAKLKSWGFCTKPYYAYDAGSLLSVKTSAHKEIGFNQWDEQWEEGAISSSTGGNVSATGRIRSKNLIPVLPSTVYYFHSPFPNTNQCTLYFYDINEAYLGVASQQNAYEGTFTTPSDAWYMRFNTGANSGATYQNNICINLHWDGERDVEYSPYSENTYPLDSDLELRGIPKLDANNNLYYDGDSYAPDGTVTRRYGIVDLATLDWSDSSATRYISKTVTGMKPVPTSSTVPNIKAVKYRTVAWTSGLADNHDGIAVSNDNNAKLYLYKDENTSTPSGYMVFELATTATESADPYQETQICNDFGTEEFVDSRTVPMPVGYNAFYQANLRAKLEMAPDSPNGNGDYIVRQTDGLNEYVLLEKELPTAPAEDGTYSLKCTVADGTATLSWVADA